MARIRSPNYPAISLAEALQRVAQVHGRERQHLAARDVVIKGMGYGGTHGTSLGALSAAVKYGLLEQEGKGKDYRVSDRAMAILHPHTPEEKAQALEQAARSPVLFAELLDHFKGDLPSDDNLRAYLVRRGFSQSSLPEVIQAFRDTMELVSATPAAYSSGTSAPPPPVIQEAAGTAGGSSRATAAGATVKPMTITFNGEHLEISARLTDGESIDRLIKALEANKPLLPEKAETPKPAES